MTILQPELKKKLNFYIIVRIPRDLIFYFCLLYVYAYWLHHMTFIYFQCLTGENLNLNHLFQLFPSLEILFELFLCLHTRLSFICVNSPTDKVIG